MQYQLFKHSCRGVGSCVSVWIDPQSKVVKRIFKPGMPLVSGLANDLSSAQLDENFKNEVSWLLKLKHTDYVPQLYDVDMEGRTIYQEYLGPDLLSCKESPDGDFLKSQERYLEYLAIQKDLIGSFRLLKLNHSLSNMALHQGRFKIFDFKWAVDLNQHSSASRQPLKGCQTVLDDEIYAYQHYMTKLNSCLPSLLQEYLVGELRGLIGHSNAKS